MLWDDVARGVGGGDASVRWTCCLSREVAARRLGVEVGGERARGKLCEAARLARDVCVMLCAWGTLGKSVIIRVKVSIVVGGRDTAQ